MLPADASSLALVSAALGIGLCAGYCAASSRRIKAEKAGLGVVVATKALLHYNVPHWVPATVKKPKGRIPLAALPTPLQRWELPRIDPVKTELWVKRDDISGCELSGNKVRKLEFLLAEALAQGCDSVITVGGIQSNHCRATAAAARRVGLEPHIILRTDQPARDPGFVGNLMIDRMVGARIHLVGDKEFASKGGWQLVRELSESLATDEGLKSYGFPSGGSSALGTWGYIEAIDELKQQLDAHSLTVDRIYFACGSGGTAAGLSLGLKWSGLAAAGTELVGLCVDDTPDFFYDKLDALFEELHVFADGGGCASRRLLRLEDCVGAGYAKSTTAELEYLVETARATGIVLDPVYSGKAALGMAADLEARPCKRAVFVHTGGLLGLFAKEAQLAPLLAGGWCQVAH